MLCQSRRAARRCRWERWPGKERRGSASRCALSLSVAGRYLPPPGKQLPWDSRGQHAASLLCRQKREVGGKRKNAFKGLSTGEMVCSQEYSLQGKTKKCPLRFSSSFEKTQEILKAKENQIFFALSGNNGCLLRRSDPGTPADLRGLWVRCQDSLKPEIFSSLPCKAAVQPVTYPRTSPEAAGARFSSSRAAAGEGTGIQQTFHRGHRFRD